MAAKRESKAGGFGVIAGEILLKVLEMVGAGGSALAGLKRSAEKRAGAFVQKQGLKLNLMAWISAGKLMAIVGFCLYLIDSAGLPRGPVFMVAGLLVVLASLLGIYVVNRMHYEDRN